MNKAIDHRPPPAPLFDYLARQEQREALRAHQGPHFDGQTYDKQHDQERLSTQLAKVRALMLDGQFRTLAEIAHAIGAPESSVSARLRDLKKPRFGAYIVPRRIRGERSRGLWEYAVFPRQEAA